MAKRYHLSQKDRDLIGRTIRTVQGMGRGERPLPRRRRHVENGSEGSPGASGTFICTLSGNIPAGDISNRGEGAGTVYSMTQGAENTELGTRIIWNPYLSIMPQTAASETVIYTCAKTYEHVTPETEDDDEFTITGVDPFYLLASRSGFAEKTSLAVGEAGTTPADIEWLGAECEA